VTINRSAVSRVFKAPALAVYQAFLDPEALAYWLAPDGMTAKVHWFEARVGGKFRITLTYDDPDSTAGKSADNHDTYKGRFVELVPNEKIVQTITFETKNPKFTGEMTISVQLRKAERGTNVEVVCDNMPPGIAPKDNEAGWKTSLKKLSKLVE
jgi:uncharacterized protein YndB with AHSA1/START domain